MAPDPASLSAGRKLASGASWPDAGADARVVWGLAKGSGVKPYQAAVDLGGPAFECSCPSRKIPCKHVLALLLRWSAGDVPDAPPAAFAVEWLASRNDRAEASAERAEVRAAKQADPAAKARRSAAREAKINGGVEELRRLLDDLVRQGLAAARDRPLATWDQAAARMIDAQAPGLAGEVRALGDALHGTGDWPSAALARAARLHAVAAGWQRREQATPALQAALRTAVGWPVPSEEVLAQPPVADRWAVVGRTTGADDRLHWRRTWLLGEATRREGQHQRWAPRAGGFEGPDLMTGSLVEGDLCFFPAGQELRAVPRDELLVVGAFATLPERSVADVLAGWGAALTADPTLQRWPVVLAPVRLAAADGRWHARDAAGDALPLAGLVPWGLVAAAGGHELGLTGEWSAAGLWPIAGVVDGVVVSL